MYQTYPTGPSQSRNRNAVHDCVLMAAAMMSLLSTSAGYGDQVPEGLRASDWSSIREVYEANRHVAFAVDGGYVARNPGQQWRTRFDGRGFETTPDAGKWAWGLELSSFDGRAVAQPECVDATGRRVEYQWDENFTEWYVNDQRGLEHGYTVHRRPSSALRAAELEKSLVPEAEASGKQRAPSGRNEPLRLLLVVRGDLRPRVSGDGRNVAFVSASGAAVVNYAGLKVFDADGAEVPAWFEAVDDGLRLSVRDAGARYPLTIDPIAQQAYLKASTTGTFDAFGYSVAVSGDTVVVGAVGEDSNATGVNGNQADNSASGSGAAYVFMRVAGVWSQQALPQGLKYG